MKKDSSIFSVFSKWILVVGVFYPCLFIVAIWSFFFRAWIYVGHAPYGDNPAALSLGYETHYGVVKYSTNFIPLSAILMLFVVVRYLITGRAPLNLGRPFVLVVFSIAIALLLSLMSPAMMWFIDA